MGRIGYARVSTTDQKLEKQLDALEKYSCKIIFKEKVTDHKAAWQMPVQMLQMLKEGRSAGNLQTQLIRQQF